MMKDDFSRVSADQHRLITAHKIFNPHKKCKIWILAPLMSGDSHVGKDKAWGAGNLLLLQAITFLEIDTVSEFNATPKH